MEENHIPFQRVIDALLGSKEFPAAYLKYFSDIDPVSLKALMQAWPQVAVKRKHTLLKKLEALMEEDTLVSFEDLARALLTDEDPEVRTHAIHLLAECEDPRLVPTYIDMLEKDASEEVRAEAAGSLGEFVMLGELEEISRRVQRQAEDALLKAVSGEDHPRVRRRALESLGYSSRPEVMAFIESAFNRQDPEWKASALFAMGRSSDDRWQDHVIQMLVNEHNRVRLAAVQAAGELSLAEARPLLIKLLDEEDEDDVAGAAIWSLSQIGGEDARTVLQSLVSEAEDEELLAFLEDALENLAFTEDLERFDLLSFDPEDEVPEDEEPEE